jgi:putative ABC transport system permease protein
MAGDVRFAVRNLRRAPGFALTAILTLGLGIGATTTIFSVVYGVLLRPLPYPDYRSLVAIQAEVEFPSGIRTMNFSGPEIETVASGIRSLSNIGAVGYFYPALRTADGIEALNAAMVSKTTFATLGRQMLMGRAVAGEADPDVVISHRLWQRVYAGDMNVLGKGITLTDREGRSPRTYTIVGVAPPDFQYSETRTDLWRTIEFAQAINEGMVNNRNNGAFFFIGRLKAGATPRVVAAETNAIIDSFRSTLNETRRGSRAKVERLADQVAGTIGPALQVLFGAVGLVLLIACANVANLMLARQSSRARETAVRIAMGAPRGRLIRQLLSETLIVAMSGAALGTAMAWGGVATLQYLKPSLVPGLDAIHVDGPIFAFALLAAVVTTVVAGLVPALVTTRSDVALVMRGNSRTDAGSVTARRLRSALVVSEIAVSIVLLVGATLLARSLAELIGADIGVRREHVLAAHLDTTVGRQVSNARQIEIAGTLTARLGAMPGVESVGFGTGLPPAGEFMRFSFELNNAANPGGVSHMVTVVPANAGYFSTLQIPLLRGRLFTDADNANGARVLVVNREAARRFFGDADPIGQTLPMGLTEEEARRGAMIVGVVDNVKFTGIAKPDEATVFRPWAQNPFRMVFLVARTSGDPATMANNVHQLVREYDKDINILKLQSLDTWVSDSVALPRFRALLLSSIAIIALMLAVIGLYGVIAYSVTQRTTELGIRIALGARAVHVNQLVVSEGLRLALIGAAFGLAGAFALRQTLAGFLYAVKPADLVSFAGAAGLLIVIAVAACYVPSRRASRVDPVVALRAE